MTTLSRDSFGEENQGVGAAAKPPASLLHKLFTKLAMFAVACVVGWAVAWIIHGTVQWWQSPTSSLVASIGAELRRIIQFILNALYR